MKAEENDIVEFAVEKENNEKVKTRNEQLKDWKIFNKPEIGRYEATKEITKYAEENNYNLSFTGHSLGVWLAELSLYFAHRDFHYPKAKAITFDSPGLATENLQPQML